MYVFNLLLDFYLFINYLSFRIDDNLPKTGEPARLCAENFPKHLFKDFYFRSINNKILIILTGKRHKGLSNI